jgi:hypothetical protein
MDIRNPIQVRYEIRSNGLRYDQEGRALSDGARGALLGQLSKNIKESYPKATVDEIDRFRYALFGWMFGSDNKMLDFLHSKDLTPGQFMALAKWINVTEIEGNWLPAHSYESELRQVMVMVNIHFAMNQALGTSIAQAEKAFSHAKYVDVSPGEMVDFATLMGGVITRRFEDVEEIVPPVAPVASVVETEIPDQNTGFGLMGFEE